jgi:hypothetical protein
VQRRTVAETYMDAINRRDFEALAEIVDPELEFHSVIAAVEGEPFRGPDGMRIWAEQVDAVAEDYFVEVKDVLDAGERSVLLLAATGTAKASRLPIDIEFAQVWTWRGERPVRIDGYERVVDAMRAAGIDDAS